MTDSPDYSVYLPGLDDTVVEVGDYPGEPAKVMAIMGDSIYVANRDILGQWRAAEHCRVVVPAHIQEGDAVEVKGDSGVFLAIVSCTRREDEGYVGVAFDDEDRYHPRANVRKVARCP